MDNVQTKILPNGNELRYTHFGSGDCIIFLHGYPENHLVWIPLMQAMSKQFKVLTFDWPGMGGSQVWKGGSTPKVMADRIVKIMDAFKIKKAHLVGHDMGGQPALVCAASYPKRIVSATVMNSLLIHDAKTSWEIKYLRNLKLNRFFLNYLPRIVFKRALGTFLAKKNPLNPEIKKVFWADFKKKKVREYISRMCFGYQAQLPKLPKYYAQITCPVLIIWSKENKHFDIDHAHRLLDLVKTAQLQKMEGASHWLGLTQPIKTAEFIKQFISLKSK